MVTDYFSANGVTQPGDSDENEVHQASAAGTNLPAVQGFDPNGLTIQYKGVPSRAGADVATQERIDALANTIDLHDFETIINFGQEPAENLAESARDVIKRAEQVGALGRGLSSFAARAAEFGIEEISDMAERYVNKGGRVLWANKGKAMLAAAALPFVGLPGAGAVLGGAVAIEKLQKMRRAGEPVSAEELQNAINGSMLEMDEIMADLRQADKNVPELAKDIKTFSAARLSNVNELGIYIAAGQERLIKARDVEYPAITQRIEAANKDGGNAFLEAERDDLVMGMMNLNIRLSRLHTSFGSGLYTVSQLRDLTNTVQMVQAKVREHSTNSQAEWQALIADAALSSQTHDLFKSVEAADKFGDRVFDQAAKLRESTRQGAKNSLTRGALDPDKVLKMMRQEARRVRENADTYKMLNAKMVEQQNALSKGADELAEAYAAVGQAIYVSLPEEMISTRTAIGRTDIDAPVIEDKTQDSNRMSVKFGGEAALGEKQPVKAASGRAKNKKAPKPKAP